MLKLDCRTRRTVWVSIVGLKVEHEFNWNLLLTCNNAKKINEYNKTQLLRIGS